jgi:peptidoglycan hydrolase-like protein with peptidoglycan-binding domain
MSYRLAKSLEKLRLQVNLAAPGRSKKSDGWIGDARHKSSNSDHNAHVKDGATGVVTAFDVTHDPASGIHARELAESLVNSQDRRIKYIISEGQICSSKQQPWVWRKYTGKNGHFHHVHISVNADKSLYDDVSDWSIGQTVETPSEEPQAATLPLLKRGSKDNSVKFVQKRLMIGVDGDFGPKTEAAVKVFQKQKGLQVDGKVGELTWKALLG